MRNLSSDAPPTCGFSTVLQRQLPACFLATICPGRIVGVANTAARLPHVHSLPGQVLAGVRSAVGRRDIVVGLAICALLHNGLPGQPQMLTGQAVVGAVAGLRTLSNTSGVGEVSGINADPAENERGMSIEQHIVAGTFPRVGAVLYQGNDNDYDDSPVTISWGVHARGRGRVGRRKGRPGMGGQAGNGGKAVKHVDRRRPMGVGAGMSAGVKHADQRDTFSPPDGAGPGYSGAGKIKKRKKPPERASDPEPPADRQNAGQGASEGGIYAGGFRSSLPQAQDDDQGKPRSASTAVEGKACLRFDNLDRTRHQISRLPLLGNEPAAAAADVLFCVHRDAVGMFQNVFAGNTTSEGDIVAFLAIPHAPCSEGDDGMVRMYSGLGQLLRAEPRERTPLGDYRLFSVATLSVISDRTRHAHGVADDRVIPSNQFTVMRVGQCIGDDRHFISFFVRRSAPLREGVNFGFSEIEQVGANLAVRDGNWVLESNSADLGNLIPRIEDVSALRVIGRGVDGGPPEDYRHVRISGSNHGFVRLEALPSLSMDRGAGLLPAQEMQALTVEQDGRRSAARSQMYRMTFLISDDAILYVDRAGRRGALYNGVDAAGSRGLLALPGAETEFMQRHGLQGRTPGEAIVILENYGFSRMPASDEAAPGARFPLNGFRIVAGGHASPASRVVRQYWNGRSGTFAVDVDGRQVRYVDKDGREGSLGFATVRHHPEGSMVLEGNGLPDLLFARQAGLLEYLEYTWRDIRKAMHAQGLVEHEAG